jgi:hypothetical protein
MNAMFNNTSGVRNTATGKDAMVANTTGYDNTANGQQSLYSNTTGFQNVAYGGGSLRSNTIGTRNTATGFNSLYVNISGVNNSSFGSYSLYNNVNGSSNVAYGEEALWANTSGSFNTAIGYTALMNNSTGSNNTGLGIRATVATNNLINATAIGARAWVGCSNCLVLGSVPGFNEATSSVNVGIGTTAPVNQLEVIGPASAAPVTLVIGNRGAFGPAALEFVSDYGTGNRWSPGYIRSEDLGGFQGSLQFWTNITGSKIDNIKAFEIRNGIAYTASGFVGSFSDARLKNHITEFTDGLNVIRKINPVQFYYNADAPFNTDQQQVGVVAQELEKLAPYMVEKSKQNGYDDLRSVNNQAYTFLLINAVKEQQQQIEKQQKQIETSDAKMKQLQQQQKLFEVSSEEVKQLQQQVVELKKLVEQLLKK